MKQVLLALTAILSFASVLPAHHSYGMFYYTDQRVTLRGRVAKVVFDNPHVMLTIETKNSGTWTAEWTNMNTLRLQGVVSGAIRDGDILEIEGSPSRDPKSRVVSALKEIRRPSDGWRWVISAGLGVPPPPIIE